VPISSDGVLVVGVVGAGQLARMMHQATIGLGIQLRVLATSPEESAAAVLQDVVLGAWEDLDQLQHFADSCDVVTFDHELVAPEHLRALEQAGCLVRPSAAAALFAQDKLHQRELLSAAGFPVPRFRAVRDADDLVAHGDETGWPVMAKAVRGGYDGRGVWVVDDAAGAHALVSATSRDGVVLLAEEMVDLAGEVAVAVARRPGGEQVAWPVTQTVQRDGICVELVVPAPLAADVAAEARALAASVVDHVDGVGVVAVELFLTTDGRVLINELALRPHNSMHWTIEGARTSQFQNHIRAVLDLPLGSAELTAPAVATVNVLGPEDGSDPRSRIAGALAVDGVAIHLYGKSSRPGRKIGHVTALADDHDTAVARARLAAAALTGQDSA
jgi:5-(carboxyamino)imidazole ribonucleotide synthase